MKNISVAAILVTALSILIAAGGCFNKDDRYAADVISEETAFEALKSILGGLDGLIERGGCSEAVTAAESLKTTATEGV